MTQIDWYLVFPRASSSGLVYPPLTPQSGLLAGASHCLVNGVFSHCRDGASVISTYPGEQWNPDLLG